MFSIKFILMFLYLISNESVYAKKGEEIFTCVNETECVYTLEETSSTTVENIYNTTNSIISSSTQTPTQTPTFQLVPTTQVPHKIKFNNEARNQSLYKIDSDICECDLTVNFYFLISDI